MTLDGFLDAIGVILIVGAVLFFVVLAVAIVDNAIRNGDRPGD